MISVDKLIVAFQILFVLFTKVTPIFVGQLVMNNADVTLQSVLIGEYFVATKNRTCFPGNLEIKNMMHFSLNQISNI